MWWWVTFIPVAMLVGGVCGLLVRTHRAELAKAAVPVGQIGGVAPVAPATEGWRWLFSKQEWRGPAHGIGEYQDGLLKFHGSITRPQTSADAAIRARVVIHGPLPPPASVFLRGTPAGVYRWVLDVARHNVRLLDETKGQVRELGRYQLAKPLVEGDRVLLELRATGGDIIGSINGAEVVRAHDARGVETGSWGIAGDGVWLEAVEVWEPKSDKAVAVAPEKPPVSEPQAPVATPISARPVAPVVVAPAPAVPPPTAVPATPAPIVQTLVTPVPITPVPGMDTAKWLATIDAQWRGAYDRQVTLPFEKGAVELRRQHLVAVDSPLAAATKAGRDAEAAAWRAEREQVAKGSNPPFTDDDATPPALKLLRANFRAQFARLDKERFERGRALFAKCDDLLAKSQAALVQRQRADEAANVQKERDQLREAWLQPPMVITTALPPRSMAPAATPAKIPQQEVVARLMELNAEVTVKRAKGDNVQLKSETDLADEKYTIMRVEFRTQKRDETQLTTADYAILDSLTDVPEIVLTGTAVKDSVMEKLRPLHALRSLALNDAKPSPAGYAVLPTLPELRELQLNESDTNDVAMKTVLQCHKLQRLHLANLPVTDAGLVDIGKLPALEELEMSGLTKLESPGFAHLPECRALKRLYVGGFIVLSGMVEHISHCKELEALSIANTGLKDADIATLGALPKLKTLDLNTTLVTGYAFAAWPQRAQLTSLNLSNAGGVDDTVCKQIEHTFPKLEDLTVKLAPTFSSEGAAALARLRVLRSLRLDGDGINDEVIAELVHCEAITNLSITDAQVTDAGAASLARLTHLTDLSLDFPPITDSALKSFARCKALKTIHIGKDALPDTEYKFLKGVPGLTVIRPED